MTRKEFAEMTGKVVLLDGATGSNMLAAGMPHGSCTEAWILEHPEVLVELQKNYVEAGSQILYAPTFGANRKNLESKGLEKRIWEMNLKLVELSKRAAAGKALVAGNLATSGLIMNVSDHYSSEDAMDMYREQISCLVDAGVDLLAAETMINIEEAVACVKAARDVCDLPIMCSMTVNRKGRIFCGGTAVDAVIALQEAGASAVGINCSVDPSYLGETVTDMKAAAKVPILVKPNAGLPRKNEEGKLYYEMKSKTFADYMERLMEKGADLVGGCCGTTPEYIRELKKRIDYRIASLKLA